MLFPFDVFKVLACGSTVDISTVSAKSSADALLKALNISGENFYDNWVICEKPDAEYIIEHSDNELGGVKYFYRRRGEVLLKELRKAETLILQIDKKARSCSENNGKIICNKIKQMIEKYCEEPYKS